MKPEFWWFVGFFEGEGSILLARWNKDKNLSRGGRWVYPNFEIGNTERVLLERAQEITGVGKIYGPYEARGPLGKKQQYFWKVHKHAEVQQLVRLLMPLLVGEKIDKLNLALAEINNWEFVKKRAAP